MAIHPKLPGLEVTIDVNNQDLVEYNDDDDADADPLTCTKYVEAVSGAEFGFAILFQAGTFPYPSHAISVYERVDGEKVGRTLHSPWAVQRADRKVSRGAARNSVIQPMFFSELRINEEAPDKSLFGKLGQVGTLTIDVCKGRIEVVTPLRNPTPHHRHANKAKAISSAAPRSQLPVDGQGLGPKIPDGRVSEKTLKGMALTHQAIMGPARPLRRGGVGGAAQTTQFVQQGSALATFVFKYRSRAALQALHVIPRTPSPVPLGERPVEDLSVEEMRELIQRQRTNADANGKVKVKKEIKRERVETNDDDGDGGVQLIERPNKKARTGSRSGGGEVIDLSSD